MEEIEEAIRRIEQGQDRLSRDDPRQLADLKSRLDVLRKAAYRHKVYCRGDWVGYVLLNWYDMSMLNNTQKPVVWDQSSGWTIRLIPGRFYIAINKGIIVIVVICPLAEIDCSALLFTDNAKEYM